jgi:GNAT superfamily N-acetyltransferase
MDLTPYGHDLAPEVCRAYNRAVQGLPHCHPVDEAHFDAAIGNTDPTGKRGSALRDRLTLVARDGASVAGFVDVGIGELGGRETGIIRFLCYERGNRKAGQALLDAAQIHLRQRGATEVQAFPQEHRYPFYLLKAAYLSERMDHVLALLTFNGYERTRGEVFLDWPDCVVDAPPAFDMPLKITVDHPTGNGTRPGLTVRASLDGREAGVCKNVCCGEYSPDPAAQDWLFTVGLGVDEEIQGRGLGKYLQLRALHEMRALGYRHAAISTAWDNHRAFLFYSNLGYRTSDWTYGLRRILPERE